MSTILRCHTAAYYTRVCSPLPESVAHLHAEQCCAMLLLSSAVPYVEQGAPIEGLSPKNEAFSAPRGDRVVVEISAKERANVHRVATSARICMYCTEVQSNVG